MSDNTGSGYLTVYFKELYTIIYNFCLVFKEPLCNLYTRFNCLVLRKFCSRFMFYLVLRNQRPKFYNMDMIYGTDFLVI